MAEHWFLKGEVLDLMPSSTVWSPFKALVRNNKLPLPLAMYPVQTLTEKLLAGMLSHNQTEP